MTNDLICNYSMTHRIKKGSFAKKLLSSIAAALAVIICITLGADPLAASAASKTSGKTASAQKTLTATEIFEKCRPACVEIKVTDSCGAEYIGSGFYVDKYNIITNMHVINNASKLQVFTTDGKELTLKSIYGASEEYDLALLRVKEKNTKYLKISETPAVAGETVYCIGSPVGVTGSFMRGMVANENRVVSGQNYVQLDIPSGKGIGGAPAINERGEVIGVMCLTVPSGSNMNLALNIDVVNKFLSGLTKKDRISLKDFYAAHKDGLVEPNAINLIEKSSYKNTSYVYEGVLEERTPVEIYNDTVTGLVEVVGYTIFGGMAVNSSGGTGFFVDHDTIVTNHHIVKGMTPDLVVVYDYADNIYEVTDIIFGEAVTDVAILKVRLYKAAEGGEDFRPTVLHLDSDYIPAAGEDVYAIGNPQNYLYSISNGIVSIPSAIIEGMDYTVHCAATSPGSSGGVLVNRYGDVIGITNMMATTCENMCFSIKIKYATELLKKMNGR